MVSFLLLLSIEQCMCSLHLSLFLLSRAAWQLWLLSISLWDGQISISLVYASLLNLPLNLSDTSYLHADVLKSFPMFIKYVFTKESKEQTIRMFVCLAITVTVSLVSFSPFLEDRYNAAHWSTSEKQQTVFANSSWIKCQSAQRTLGQHTDLRQCWWQSRSAWWLTAAGTLHLGQII